MARDYLQALEAEIGAHCWRWRPETVYLGGGTPSRMPAENLRRVLAAIPGAPWREATIEAAPGSFTPELAARWRDAGLTRVSLGVQSFIDAELSRTGRRHDASVVASDLRALGEAGFGSVNIDLIAGLPHQTPASWRDSLDWVERLGVPHVSVYMLEIDEDSRLGAEILGGGSRYGARAIPDEEIVVEMYETAVDRLAALGLARYEISNFASPGRESLHNLKYWRREPYAGFGADAHSFDGSLRRRNVETAAAYIDCWRRGRSPGCEESAAGAEEEQFFLGLRLTAGIRPGAAARRRFDRPIRRFLAEGLLEQDGEVLRLTRRGVLLSNEVFQEFVGS